MSKFLKLVLILSLIIIASCNNKKTNNLPVVKNEIVKSYLDSSSNYKLSISERTQILRKAIKINSTIDNKIDQIKNNHKISFEFYDLENMEEYKNVNEEALSIAEKFGDSLLTAKSNYLVGLYYRENNFEKALKYFNESELIYSDVDRKNLIKKEKYSYNYGKVLLDIAQILKSVKNYTESENYTIRAINNFKLAEKYNYMHISYNNLGIIAKNLGRFDDAVKYFQKSIDYSNDTNSKVINEILGFNNIGTVYK